MTETTTEAVPVDTSTERLTVLQGIGCADYLHMALAAERDALQAFAEEVRDAKPEIHSGQAHDPQDTMPDMVDAEWFETWQDDANTLLNEK